MKNLKKTQRKALNTRFNSIQILSTLILVLLFSSQCSKDELIKPEELKNLNVAKLKATVSINNSGFESNWNSWSHKGKSPISSESYRGSKSGKIYASGGEFSQVVRVSKNTDYELTSYVKGSWRFGALINGLKKTRSGNTSKWKRETVKFNSGSATSITILAQYKSGIGRYDEFKLVGSGNSGGNEGGGDSGGVAGYPSSKLNLKNWKLTLPIGSDNKPTEIKQPALNNYKHNTYFHLNSAGSGVVFRAHCGGTTTSGSSYPRSELREMNSSSKASWSTTSGTHSMTIRQAITHLPNKKKHVVAGQIHDKSDDVIVYRLEDKKLFIDINGKDGPILTNNYNLGTTFTVKFVASGGKIKCYYNGSLKYTYSKKTSGCYFKAGCYTQSNTSKGDSSSAYGEVVIYDLSVSHN